MWLQEEETRRKAAISQGDRNATSSHSISGAPVAHLFRVSVVFCLPQDLSKGHIDTTSPDKSQEQNVPSSPCALPSQSLPSKTPL